MPMRKVLPVLVERDSLGVVIIVVVVVVVAVAGGGVDSVHGRVAEQAPQVLFPQVEVAVEVAAALARERRVGSEPVDERAGVAAAGAGGAWASHFGGGGGGRRVAPRGRFRGQRPRPVRRRLHRPRPR